MDNQKEMGGRGGASVEEGAGFVDRATCYMKEKG